MEMNKITKLEKRIERLELIINVIEKRLIQKGVLEGYKSAWRIYDGK